MPTTCRQASGGCSGICAASAETPAAAGPVSIVNQQTILLNSYAIKHLIDRLMGAQPGDMTQALLIALAAATPLLVFILWRVGGNWLMWFLSYRTGPLFTMHTRAEIFAYVQQHRPSFFDSQLSGRIIQKSSDLAGQMEKLFSQALWDVGPGLVYFVTAFVLVATVSVPLSLCLLVWFTLFFIVAYKVGRAAFGENSQKLNE